MIITKQPLLILLVFGVFYLSQITAQVNYRPCRQTCGSSKPLSYPFGFSSGCAIRLNCTRDGGIFIGEEFPVESVDTESIIVSIKAQCNRSFESFHHLFSHKYAPTSGNVIFLRNCSKTASSCTIAETLVRTDFESEGCSGSDGSSLSCYFENNMTSFLNKSKLEGYGCGNFMSSMMSSSKNLRNNSGEAVSLEVGKIELGWWVQGDCNCSPDANCTRIESPVGRKPGFRCHCKEGFVGDGFTAGTGCREASSACNPAKYMSGRCGGTARFVVLIGGFVFGASLMIAVVSACCFFRRRTKFRVTKSTKRRFTEATVNYSVPIYPYKDIERATNSFSEKQRLGTGAYGTVYAGKLYNNEWVAIKRIKHRDTDSIEQVMNEIKLLSSVSHANLVRLLGSSIENGEQILVYEFMCNGTLSQNLQRERGNGLSWSLRLTIATETAQAIAHLHSAINPPIYHRDIKSSNILLDHNFGSKVADFGLSRLGMTETSHISTAPQGTPGYVDPQYHQDFHLSDKSDVYSFGVVLIEIITGLKAVDFSRPHNEVNLASLATDRIGKGLLDEIIDPLLEPEVRNDAWTLSSIHKVAELAFRCLAFHRDMRPSMSEVAAELEQLRLSRWTSLGENNCTASTELTSCSSSSSESEKPLSTKVKKVGSEGKGHLGLQTGPIKLRSFEGPDSTSPVSVQDRDVWLSEHSSSSSIGFPSKSFD